MKQRKNIFEKYFSVKNISVKKRQKMGGQKKGVFLPNFVTHATERECVEKFFMSENIFIKYFLFYKIFFINKIFFIKYFIKIFL